jgi:sugar transferase (PEP-CTERM/EpsH1 system associated)
MTTVGARREFLFLSHRIPYPPDKGDKIRSWRLLDHLVKRFDVHLCAFVDEPADFAHEAFLKSICASVRLAPLDPKWARARSAVSVLKGEPLTYGYYADRGMRRAVADLRRRDLAGEFAFSSSMAPYLEPAIKGRPRIADICDADSEKWREYARDGGLMGLVYAREHRLLAAEETAIINSFDATLAVSRAEGELLASRPGVKRKVIAVGNGVDTDYFTPNTGWPKPDDAGDIVFVGAMDYKPNADAALWFARDVFPAVRRARPDIRLAIVGAKPSPDVLALTGQAGIAVTGRVADVRPYLQHARAVIAPLKIARGVQNKVLEAMAAGKPVVATRAANTGIDAVPGGEIYLADDAPSFTAQILEVVKDPKRAGAIGAAARARAAAEFSWSARLKEFDDALAGAGVG